MSATEEVHLLSKSFLTTVYWYISTFLNMDKHGHSSENQLKNALFAHDLGMS